MKYVMDYFGLIVVAAVFFGIALGSYVKSEWEEPEVEYVSCEAHPRCWSEN